MNYLAHLYLAEPTPDSLIGNLIADFVKGRDLGHLPPGVAQGIWQHRRVDSFTDCHPLVQRSIGRISPKWGWFSGILIDVWYDHILATTWENWSAEPLRVFVDRVQLCLTEHIDLAPPGSRNLIGKLIATDRLYSYSTPEGIHETLFRLSGRIRERMPGRNIQLELALSELQDHLHALSEDFQTFFPELIEHVASLRSPK